MMDTLHSGVLLVMVSLTSSSGGLRLGGRWISGNLGMSTRRMPLGVAKKDGETEAATLLEGFKSDATKTRHAVRVELGLLDNLAAEMFALVVFVSDGILQIKDTTTATPAARFFSLARRLPLELQMVLCHLVMGSAKEIISGKESEVAFKSLAESLQWSLIFTS